MSTPPALPTRPRRKVATVIIVVCVCLCTLALLIFLIGYLEREGLVMFRSTPTRYFYPADLKTRNLPAWQVTNAIPLTPDQAVLAAMRHASTTHPGVTTWDVDGIHLQREFDTTWTYNISLTDRRSGGYAFEVVRVLMDGSIWKPTTEKRVR